MKRLKPRLLWCLLLLSAAFTEAAEKPNFIVILADDLGYGDLACYGAKDIVTPPVDQMAREGTKFTSCYVAPVCSPTRAALMTGCVAQRVGNGPNTSTGGSAGPLKGDKGSTLEGGVRVPFIARLPGCIPAGTESNDAITGIHGGAL